MNLDITAQLRYALGAISLGSPYFFVAWIAFAIVINGVTGLFVVANPGDVILADFATRTSLHYAIAYLIMWLASWRTRSDLRQDDEHFVRLITRLSEEADLSAVEKRQMLRDALRAEIERRKSLPITPHSSASKSNKTPSDPALS